MPQSLRHALGTLILAGTVLLSGCSATSQLIPSATVAPSHATLILNPELSSIGPMRTQAVVPRLTADDVDHVRVQLLQVNGDTLSSVKDDDGPLALWIQRSELTRPIVLSKLRPHTHYQVVAWAYKAADETDENEISVWMPVDVLVGEDDRPTVARLPIQLKDVPFNGKATFPSFDIRPGGYAPDGAESAYIAGISWTYVDSLLSATIGSDEDRMSPRSAAADGLPDARFHVSADLPEGTKVRAVSLYAVDETGRYLPGQYWSTWDYQDAEDRLLGVAQGGQLLNTDFVPKLGTFGGLIEFDLYANAFTDFHAGQTYNVDVILSDGSALWGEFTLPTQQEVTP